MVRETGTEVQQNSKISRLRASKIFIGFILIGIMLIPSVVFAGELQDISDAIVRKCSTVEQKIIAIKQYVYDTIHPVYGRGIEPLERVPTLERLKVGVGWCHNNVEVFMELAAKQGIKSRMLYLWKDGTSPHTICEAWNNGWKFIDPSSPFEVYKNGKLCSYDEIRKNDYFKLYKLPYLVMK